MPTELTIIVPTFCEKQNINVVFNVLNKLSLEIEWEIIYVDDNSPDGTYEEIYDLAREHERVRGIRRIGRKGLSSACVEGVLASSSPYVCIMDADLQHDEKIIPDMLNELKTKDLEVVIGSRYMTGGSTGQLADERVLVSRIATIMGRHLYKSDITDPMSGFFMFKRTFFDTVVAKLSNKGFKILLDILSSNENLSKYGEIPYVMRKRQFGESKLSTSVIWDFFTLLVDKLLGRIFPLRFLLFSIVGFSGIFIHFFSLWLIYSFTNTEFILSQILATVIAMTSNYILNNAYTYRDTMLKGFDFIRGLSSFYLACALGAVINISLADGLVSNGIAWWIAGVSGAIAGAVWNYAVTAIFTWKQFIE